MAEVDAQRASVVDRVVATHMMIRVALTGISLAIVVSVVYQRLGDGCSLTSISAYWYTDARPIFAGGLMVISVCLLAYSGGTWTENLLLNLAGVLAPIVALAPTRIGKPLDKACLDVRAPDAYDSSATHNGLLVYTTVLLAGAAFTLITSRELREQIADQRKLTHGQGLATRVGRVVALVVAVGVTAWGFVDDHFPQHAHFPSAAIMFFFLALVAAARTDAGSRLTARWDLYRDSETLAAASRQNFNYSRLNAAVAISMIATLFLAAVNLVLEKMGGGFDYGVIVAEFAMLGLFLVFWLAQTIQMRNLTQFGKVDGNEPPTNPAEDDGQSHVPGGPQLLA